MVLTSREKGNYVLLRDKVQQTFRLEVWEVWARFLSPILKPKSLEIFPPSHLTVFYLHPKWLGSQITWQIPSDFGCWLRDILGPSNIVIYVLYFVNSYMWRYIVWFTIHAQKAVSVLFTDKLYVWCRLLRQHRVLRNFSVGCYGAAFSGVTIVFTRYGTIVLTLMHGNVNADRRCSNYPWMINNYIAN